MEEKRPTAEQMAKFKKNSEDKSLSAEIRAKFKAIVDKFSTDVKELEGEKPKSTRGRKPSASSATTRKTSTAKVRATKADIDKAKAEIKAKTGKTEEECESIIEQYRALRTKAQEGKRKAEQASADNKKRVSKLDKKGDIIEGTNEKTADAVIESTAKDVAEKIEKQIEAVEAKAETEAKAEVAKDKTITTPKAKKEAVEAKVEKKVAEKTKTIVKRVVIDTSALLSSIATSLGKFDKDSQKEFLIKLRSDIDKLLAKYAFGGMTDGATQVMNVQQSNLSASSVNPTLFAGGGGVKSAETKKIIESISEIRFDRLPPIKERTMSSSAYQKILLEATKYAIKELYRNDYYDIHDIQKATTDAGGVYNKAFVDLYGKKLTYANGGGVGVSNSGAKIRVDSVSIDVYEDSYEEGEGKNVNSYSRNELEGKILNPNQLVKFLHDELYTSDEPTNYSILDNAIFTSQLVDEDGSKASESEIDQWKKGNLNLYSENIRIGVSIIFPTETTDEELSKLTGIGLYKKGGKVKISKQFAGGGGVKSNSKEVKEKIRKHILESVYDFNENEFDNFNDASKHLTDEFRRVADYPNNLKRFPNNQKRFQDYLQGVPFNFYFYNDDIENYLNGLGINPKGKKYSSDQMWNLYSLLIWREVEPTYKSKTFAGGGGVDSISYDEVLNVLKEILEDSVDDLPMKFENSSNYTGEEVEHESRDGFIPYTDGGYEVRWFEYISGLSGGGYSLPTKALDDEMQRQVDYQYETAKQLFIDEYPEIAEELGEENIDYNSLQEAGYEDEAEELSEMEMNYDGEDSIMCEIGAYYYTPSNDRGIDGQHTLRLFGLVNLESPYHRSGNLEDRYDIDITFDSISELEEKVEEGIKEITEWFDGSKYNESTEKLRIVRMAKGGMTEHGLEIGDEIIENRRFGRGDEELVVYNRKNKEKHFVNLDEGKRYKKGGITEMLRNRRGK